MISPKGPVTFATEWQKSEPKPISLDIKLIPYTALAFPVGNWKIIYYQVTFKINQVILESLGNFHFYELLKQRTFL